MASKISILGATGSIGTQALDVCRCHNIPVETLTAGSNYQLLAQQAKEFTPKQVAIEDDSKRAALEQELAGTGIKVYSGADAISRLAATDDSDLFLNSIVGIAGLRATLSGISAKKHLALANKESLVTAGELVMEAAKKQGVKILPVDSEHSAIFQCLNGENWDKIESVVLTASGGPFFGYSTEQLKKIKKQDALRHPNWSMGAKLTIDSSTLMNKGLEFIEAMHFFSVKPEQIQVVVHRESILHSGVEFIDGSVIAQLGAPDMRMPIQYALCYPDRVVASGKRLSLTEIGKLSFYPPDLDTFTCLRTTVNAAKLGGLAPAVVNGANEMAVELFLQDKIDYYGIFDAVGSVLDHVDHGALKEIEDVFEADRLARQYVLSMFR